MADADLILAAVAEALDRLECGIIIVDAKARILFASRSAETTLAGRCGLAVNDRAVTTRDRSAARGLRRRIAGCDAGTLGSAGGLVDIPREEGRSPLQVLVAPVERAADHWDMGWLGNAQPVAILIINDREEQHRVDKQQLRRRFGLTGAEASVAIEIAKGDGTKAAAMRLGISPTTARSHLKQIFEKTGAVRQAGLVRLLLQNAARSG